MPAAQRETAAQDSSACADLRKRTAICAPDLRERTAIDAPPDADALEKSAENAGQKNRYK